VSLYVRPIYFMSVIAWLTILLIVHHFYEHISILHGVKIFVEEMLNTWNCDLLLEVIHSLLILTAHMPVHVSNA